MRGVPGGLEDRLGEGVVLQVAVGVQAIEAKSFGKILGAHMFVKPRGDPPAHLRTDAGVQEPEVLGPLLAIIEEQDPGANFLGQPETVPDGEMENGQKLFHVSMLFFHAYSLGQTGSMYAKKLVSTVCPTSVMMDSGWN